MVTDKTTEFDGIAGMLYYFSITGHNGHTTKFQIEDSLGWHDVADENGDVEHTDTHLGSFRMPHTGRYRINVAGGTGDICIMCSHVRSA